MQEQLQQLLFRPESETLDFKSKAYDLSTEWGRFALVKDVVCMANTPRDHASYIILGVECPPFGKCIVHGVESHPDDELLHSQFTERVYPIPSFRYLKCDVGEKTLGVIEIPPSRNGPSAPLRDCGHSLRQWQIYFRRGSKNDVATPADVVRIGTWFSGVSQSEVRPADSAWDRLQEFTASYSATSFHVLVVSPDLLELDAVATLGDLPWGAVIDFDPQSESHGVLSVMKARLSARRGLHLVTLSDALQPQLTGTTSWIFARGLHGRDSTLSTGTPAQWRKTSRASLYAKIRDMAGRSGPQPAVVTVLWSAGGLHSPLRMVLEDCQSLFGDRLTIVFVTSDPAQLHPLPTEVDGHVVAGPMGHLLEGMGRLGVGGPIDAEGTYLPGQAGVPLEVPSATVTWLQEEIELVHLGLGRRAHGGGQIGTDFLRGAEIEWFELGLHVDIERDLFAKVSRQVRQDLQARRTHRINLYHAPGAGGTTLGRRLLWNFHDTYPCAIVRRASTETVERVFRIASTTELPAVLLVDGAEVSERQLDELFAALSVRHVPAVIVQVLRRFTSQATRGRSFYLAAPLSDLESQRFLATYSNTSPGRRRELEQLVQNGEARHRSAFFFGLVAFHDDFLGLEPYVKSRLDQLTKVQQNVVGFVAIAHHYGHKPLPAQAFADQLGLPKNRPVDLASALAPALDLLVETGSGTWRTAHDLIAYETVQQILMTGSHDRRTWNQQLSEWAREFAAFCRGSDPERSEALLEVARRVFIYRDNSELIGTERSATELFAQIIQDIPSPEGALEVLRFLTDVYAEEAHFWAHLGRFHSHNRRDWLRAIECIDRALAMDDEDSVLHHMKGMVLRASLYEAMSSPTSVGELVRIARRASESFERGRNLNPENEHGHISEAQMLIRLLEHAGRGFDDGVWGYMASSNADPWLREGLQRAEGLLELVRRSREGGSGSTYEASCRARIDAIYGRHDKAPQTWDNLLARPGIYGPPIRRQVVWAYLARRGRTWDGLTNREADRIVELLEQNIREEPDRESNLRLWVQGVRRATTPPSIERVIERVTYWRANSDSLDAVFYLYVMHALLCFEGFVTARDAVARFIEESRQKARIRRNRTVSSEWLGGGSSLRRLVHHSQLGEWDQAQQFWKDGGRLERVEGRIARILGPQAGELELTSGLRAFFVPGRGDFTRGQDENKQVSCFLGFSYEGLRAWEVKAGR